MGERGIDEGAFRRLQFIRLTALSDGMLAAVMAYYVATGFGSYDWLMVVISFCIGLTVHGAVVYFGCMIFVPKLSEYVISDDTRIRGSNVEMVTRTQQSGDARVDRWVQYYVTSRNLFGTAIVPLVLLGGLFLFS